MPSASTSRLRELRADESATRVLARAQHTVDRSSVMILYGQRLALLSQVSAAMHVIVVEEERERKEIRDLWDYEGWMRGVLEGEGKVVAAVLKSARGLASTPTTTDVRPLEEPTRVPDSDATYYMSVVRPVGEEDTHAVAPPPLQHQLENGSTQPPSNLHPSETLTTTRRYKLSPSAMLILSDPATTEKILAAKRDRSIAQLLKQTRPAPDAVPRLHFVPPLRLQNTIDRSFKAPILEALYGPTTADDALLEGRPAHTIKTDLEGSTRKMGRGRSVIASQQLGSSGRQQSSAAIGHAVSGVFKSGVFGQQRTQRGGGQSVGAGSSIRATGGFGLVSTMSTVFNSSDNSTSKTPHQDGLSAALAHKYSPTPVHKQPARVGNLSITSPISNEGLIANDSHSAPPFGFTFQSPLLNKRKDSANAHGRSGHVTILGDTPPWTMASTGGGGHATHKTTPLDRPMLPRVPSTAFTALEHEEEREEEGVESDGSQSPLRSDGSQSPHGVYYNSKSSNPEASAGPHEEVAVMGYDEPWYWAEQDSSIAVAVMACVVADGLDEVMVREQFAKQEDALRHSVSEADRALADRSMALEALIEEGAEEVDESASPRGGPHDGGILSLTAIDVSAVTDAILQHQPPPKKTSAPPRAASASTRTLTTADATIIEDAVAHAKHSRGNAHATATASAQSGGSSLISSSPVGSEEDIQAQKTALAVARVEWLKKAARTFRAATNKIEVGEHENRYEVIHGEISAFKAIMHSHRTDLAAVRKTALSAQQHSKMVLERRCTLELLKIVLLWQSQHDTMLQVYYGRKAVLQRVAAGRREVAAHEDTSRRAIEEYALVLAKQLTRQIEADARRLWTVQAAYLKELAEAEQRDIERRRHEASRMERDRLIKEHEEVQLRILQKEALRKRREEQWATT